MENNFLADLRSKTGLGGELVAEFLGTMVLLLFGDGVVAAVVLYLGNSAAPPAGWLLINFGWGFAVMLGIYVAGTITGAHINPAVTLAFALRRNFPWSKVIPYWIAQVVGAFCAAVVLFYEYNAGFLAWERANGVTRGSLKSAGDAGVFFTSPHSTLSGSVVPIGWAFFDQVLGTLLLVYLIMAIVDVRNSPPGGNMAPLLIGLLIVAIGMSFGVDAGYAINPARDLGPRLWAAIAGWGQVAFPGNGPGYTGYFWVPIFAPLIGGAAGAFLYDFTIHSILEARVAPEPGMVEEGRTVVEEGRTADVTRQSDRR